ncbi:MULTISPECIES: hypothetical protein [Pectobacterium]|uniref:hypothetical protein n=1 Tax=Pectobacterium TaxID=122277 RepID=UPI001888973E|nr:hypothetical protein [Pectobacterium carotovorum]
MDLEIIGVENKGDIDNERLLLKAKSDHVNSWDYAVLDNTYDKEDCESNKNRHVFYFDDESKYVCLDRGEVICLYTKRGKYQKREVSGVLHHYFYWCLGKSIWNKDGDEVTLIKVSEKESKSV